MSRPRKLTPEQVAEAAVDRRNGMSWSQLRKKYKCATNTLRNALYEYSDEFNPIRPVLRSELEAKLETAQTDIEQIKTTLDKIKTALCERFDLHL